MIAKAFSGEPPADRMQRAGFQAEKQLAFYLDRAFGEDAYDYRVFHGLRLRRGDHTAQIDHLVLHRFGFFLVESKSIVEAVEINNHGEFTRIYKGRPQGMASPIAQARRQAELLRLLLNDHKAQLRRRVGPFKMQGEFSEPRFNVIAAIADKGQIRGKSKRPPEVMKAEAVVDVIRQRVKYQKSLDGFGGFLGSAIAEFSDKKKAKEWDENHVPALTDAEIDATTQFLLESHTPIASAERQKTVVDRDEPKVTSPQVSKPASQQATAEPKHHRNMHRWSDEEEQRLKQGFDQGRSADALCHEFGRTAKALRMRAVKIGLIKDAAEWS